MDHPRAPAAPLRVAFAGTPQFAVPSLHALLESPAAEVVAVLTRPDRPAGRGRRLTPPPVKEAALAAGLPVHQPQTLQGDDIARLLRSLAVDAVVVVAWGQLVPPTLLTLPPLGWINVHASLLPRWRGAAPIQHAILAGDRETGVSIMRLVEALDAGPVFDRAAIPIAADDTAGSLAERLARLGAQRLVLTLERLRRGEATATPQPAEGVTYAPRITPADAVLDWQRDAATLARAVRAFQPAPVARAELAGEPVRVWAAEALAQPAGQPPGSVVAVTPAGIDVATGDGVLRVTRLQRPGRRPVSAAEYLNARPALRTRVEDR